VPLARIDIDEQSLASSSDQIEHERKVAIFDLVEKNHFLPDGVEDQAFNLRLAYEDSRLILEVTGKDYAHKFMLSMAPFKTIMRDYAMICESYYEALKNATPTQIESIDMGRRGIHNDGADLLEERLKGKISLDRETARRLFTLIYALHLRS
jgi:uncharacterized protein (UPF0262 family)